MGMSRISHEVIRIFGSREMAAEYRAQSGRGGWIFAVDGGCAKAFLFPLRDVHGRALTATAVMRHPLTRGLSGYLV